MTDLILEIPQFALKLSWVVPEDTWLVPAPDLVETRGAAVPLAIEHVPQTPFLIELEGEFTGQEASDQPLPAAFSGFERQNLDPKEEITSTAD